MSELPDNKQQDDKHGNSQQEAFDAVHGGGSFVGKNRDVNTIMASQMKRTTCPR